jgi:hypothetical protein
VDDPASAGILSESLALLDEGVDIEVIIARFPAAPPEIEPMLRVAKSLRDNAPEADPAHEDSIRRVGEYLLGHI